MRRIGYVLLLTALTGACSGTGHGASAPTRGTVAPTAPTAVTSAARLDRSSVAKIESVPNPEGPQDPGYSATSFPAGFRAALARLPSVLPPPTGPEQCDLGRSVVITLRGGQKLEYGPCTIPATVNAAIDAANAVYNPSAVHADVVERAIEACRSGAPVGTLFSAGFTTVGEIRNPGPRSGVGQIADAFPGSPDTAFAAWCGRNLPDGNEQYYAVGPNRAIAIPGRH